MHDDLTPDEFRAAMAAGEPATINEGPRPSAITGAWTGMYVINGGGGGVSSRRPGVEPTSSKVSALAR